MSNFIPSLYDKLDLKNHVRVFVMSSVPIMWLIFLFFFQSWVLLSKPWKKQIRLPNLSIPSLQIRLINLLVFCHRPLAAPFCCTITSYLHIILCTIITISTKIGRLCLFLLHFLIKFLINIYNILWCSDNLANTERHGTLSPEKTRPCRKWSFFMVWFVYVL